MPQTIISLDDLASLDERLISNSFFLVDWPLSRVFLKNNADYPWFMLVPRRADVIELTEFSKADRYQLIDEINQLSMFVQDKFKPDKINIGALGNIVAQFHVHVVARFHCDLLWPQSVWQSMTNEKSYVEPNFLIADLIHGLSAIKFS